VDQDPALQLRQLRRRLQPQLVHQDLAVGLVDPQGLHLSTAAVQGQHQPGLEGVPQGMLGRQRLELRDDVGGPPASELGVGQHLVGDQAELAEPLGLGTRPFLLRELRVRSAAPQRQPAPQRPRGLRRVAPRQAGPARRHRRREAGDVEGLVAHFEHVAGRPCAHPGPDPGRSTTRRRRAT
jgi:hypothetical protein